MSINRTDNIRFEHPQLQLAHENLERETAPSSGEIAEKQDGQPAIPTARDAVIFIGPRHDPKVTERIIEHCNLHKLTFLIVETEKEGLSDQVKDDLYLTGQLGTSTEVFAFFHGDISQSTHQHKIEVQPNTPGLRTLDFIRWIRTPPRNMPEGPKRSGFHGTIHLHSCKGKLSDELVPDTELWNMGSCIAYSGRKTNVIEAGVELMLDTFTKMAQSRTNPSPLDVVDLLAHAAAISGDTIVGLGSAFSAPLVVRAPKSADEARSAYLIESLQTEPQATNCIIGTQADKVALLKAMKTNSLEQDPLRDRRKLENTLITRVLRNRKDQVDAILATDSQLSMIRMSDDTALTDLAGMLDNGALLQTILEHQYQALSTSLVAEVLGAYHANEKGQLADILKQASEKDLMLNPGTAMKLAVATNPIPDLQAYLMTWACRKGYLGLVKAFMNCQVESAKSGFAEKHIKSANGPASKQVKKYLNLVCKPGREPNESLGMRAATALLNCDRSQLERLFYEFRGFGLLKNENELTRLISGVSGNQEIIYEMLKWAHHLEEKNVLSTISLVVGAPALASMALDFEEIALAENQTDVLRYLAGHRPDGEAANGADQS